MSAFELLEDAVASPEGFGPLTIGTAVDAIQERHGIRVAFECGGHSIEPDGPDNVVAVTDSQQGVIERVDLFLPSRSGQPQDGRWLSDIETDVGVLLGGDSSMIDEAYDMPLIDLESDDPTVDREAMFVGEDGRVIVYTVVEGVVTNIRLGERSRTEPAGQCE